MYGGTKIQVEDPFQDTPPAVFSVKPDAEDSSIESRSSDPCTESHPSIIALDDSEDEEMVSVIQRSSTQVQLLHGQRLDLPSPRVRFRSRVRITGGVGRRRRLSEGLSSGASSISGSPSSSISAPLRTSPARSTKGWRPLGRRVSLLASQSDTLKGDDVRTGNRARAESRSYLDPDDWSRPTPRHYRTTGQSGYVVLSEDEWKERVIEEAFGKWPGRLLNAHWWWWQLEPIVCCFCICGDADERD